jgi:putative phosphoesterase
MRVGLIADTHDRLPAIAELVKQMQANGIGMVLHAGDYCSPFSLKPFEDAHISMAGVFGRNDGDTQGLVSRAQAGFGAELFESPHSFEIGGRRILLVHDIADVQTRSVSGHEIVIHGHTHQQEMKTRGETLIINPGEGCGWLYGTPSAAILDLDSRQVEFLTLPGSEWKY